MTENILIELKGLTKRYGYGDTESLALNDFDLQIKRGEFIMIMGPSGCGKTTLLNILGLLDRATRGDYILNGEDVAGISARRQAKLRAKKIGFVFQNFNLIQDLPIIENVALPLVYTGYGKTSRLKQASSALNRFHLQEREYYYPYQLSGGQQQRVAIARAIVGSPEIILADEPTGNLDSRSSHIVMEELKSIHEEGNTIIMVTHNPALTAYATRVINMLDGHIDTDVKTVADANLPQPISVRFKKRKHKKAAEKAAFAAAIELPEPQPKITKSAKDSKKSQESSDPESPESTKPSKNSKNLKTSTKSTKVPQESETPETPTTSPSSTKKSTKSKSKRRNK